MSEDAYRPLFYRAKGASQIEDLIKKVRNEEGYVFWSFFRDACIATSFARARGFTDVWLIDGSWPDFAITDGQGKTWDFEATEALEPDRRRDDEYREIRRKEVLGLPTWEYDPPENWLTPLTAEQWVFGAFQRKASKNYSRKVSLVIYLNAGAYGTNTEAIEAALVEAIPPAQTYFEDVWVLWEGRAYSTRQQNRCDTNSPIL